MEIRDESISYDVGIATAPRPRELALSAAWNGGLTRTVTTTDGETIAVVFGGHWTHGFGPDFADAMLDFGRGPLQTGSIEIHHHASDWVAHGHHLDPRYNDVILHIVSRDDLAETRRADGRIVPMAVLTIPDDMLFRIDARLPELWGRLGGTVCAEDLAAAHPDRVRRTLQALGDERLAERVTRFEGDLAAFAPNAVLLDQLFDGFGYSENRDAMRQLFQRVGQTNALAAAVTASLPDRRDAVLTMLLGLGGFLPLAPSDAHLAGISPAQRIAIEERWRDASPNWHASAMSATSWHRARTRPANHPLARIAALATLLARTRGDLLAFTLDALRHGEDLVAALQEQTRADDRAGLGAGRATGIVASVSIPFAIAYARHVDDEAIEDAAIGAWDRLKLAETNRPAKRALQQVIGEGRLPRLGERGHQGLLQLDRAYCTPRRCFACPIAADVIRFERESSREVVRS